SLEGVFANVGKQVESSMKSAQAAAKAGALEITKSTEKALERSLDLNRRAGTMFAAEQAKQSAALQADKLRDIERFGKETAAALAKQAA
ncbi:hypothetical protein, partial [Erwinia amylovora]|uniref:hypothetical protein n=1 Tax=Erwinia amylovora TaxID=552 RepID=UPI0020BDA2CD